MANMANIMAILYELGHFCHDVLKLLDHFTQIVFKVLWGWLSDSQSPMSSNI